MLECLAVHYLDDRRERDDETETENIKEQVMNSDCFMCRLSCWVPTGGPDGERANMRRTINTKFVPVIGMLIKAGRGGTMDYMKVASVSYSESDGDGMICVSVEASPAANVEWFLNEGWA